MSLFHYVWLQISQPGIYRSAWNFAWWFGHISDRFSPILRGIAPGMAELWASTGAIWWDMLLAEALVTSSVCKVLFDRENSDKTSWAGGHNIFCVVFSQAKLNNDTQLALCYQNVIRNGTWPYSSCCYHVEALKVAADNRLALLWLVHTADKTVLSQFRWVLYFLESFTSIFRFVKLVLFEYVCSYF